MRPLLLLALLTASCATVRPAAQQDVIATQSVSVVLDPSDPARSTLGELRYLGGIRIDPRDPAEIGEAANPRFGGFSSLKWRNGRLHAVSDVGDWLTIVPVERGGRLVGAHIVAAGDLLGTAGQVLSGTATGDAESLSPDGDGWLVAFEHEHKILHYSKLGATAEPSGLDPQGIFGALEANQGVETIARRDGRTFLCAERLATTIAANCQLRTAAGTEWVSLIGPPGLDPKTAFPVDADFAADGTLYVLMRSWSGGNDNRGALIARSPSGAVRTLGVFIDPITRDNYEGIAVREERGRTYLYMISDDNFRVYDDAADPNTWQRTLLIKFELMR